MRILLIEDNIQLSQSLKNGLKDEGHAVDTAFDGEEGLDLARLGLYDSIILDIMLPIKDGLTVCRELRREKNNTPVLMLTARDAVEDRVKGLDMGADDYLVKPFAMSELLARLRALMRRDTPNRSNLLEIGDLIIDPATHFVERAGSNIKLTSKEYSLLEYFARNPNQVITRDMIEDHIWSYDFESTSNVVDVYVRRLRRKIDDPFEVKLFETVRGSGYRMLSPNK